jgi:hypothetical protein
MPYDDYLKTYVSWLQEVAKESHEKYPTESAMIFEFIDNWIDLFPKDDNRFIQTSNSLSGIILIDSWKMTNWIGFEILCGKYFEALRNLRFVFEGCVFAVIIEDVIEGNVWNKWKNLADLWLKKDIFVLWEQCKKKNVFRYDKIDAQKINEIVTDFINQTMEKSRENKIPEYVEVYSKILSDPRLYLSTTRMIKECIIHLNLDTNDEKSLVQTWHSLSEYIHFSHQYLDAITEDGELVFVEKMNEKLLKTSVQYYFETLDFLYAILVWRLPFMKDKIIEMCKWWADNFSKAFKMTEKVLENKNSQ